ncbi:MAG: AAA family ATPase [Euryarchaeota archaeon]|nr:AAA family ATPase [Euryarchaeota archaeon]
MEEPLKTHVEGFDDQLKGGIPRGHIVLLAGNPGTMKSSLGYSILHYNALQGLRGAYLSLEQPRSTLLAQMERAGLRHGQVQEKVAVYDVTRTRLETEDFGLKKSWTFILRSLIEDAKRKTGLDVLVIDSINVYELMAVEKDVRVELFEFFTWLKDLNVTTLIISEMSMDSGEYGTHGLGFLADGILHLKNEPVDEIHSQRRIKCVKMRGVEHSTDYFSLLFRDGKFQVVKALLK